MSSESKIAANRINGRKSRGPKSRIGKLRSSRNAFRHGLNIVNRHNALYAGEIKRMAVALCDGDDNPFLFQQALIIAECAILLRCIQSQTVQLVERVRNPAVRRISNIKNIFKLVVARADQIRADIDRLEAMFAEYNKNVATFGEENVKEIDKSCWGFTCPFERDESEALREAIPDLLKFERYERRARSRQRRAIREFIRIKLMSRNIAASRMTGAAACAAGALA